VSPLPRHEPTEGAGVAVEVVYDTSSGTTIRAARRGSLMEGLRLSMLKQDRHGGLRSSGH
jgi:hypothetical protein